DQERAGAGQRPALGVQEQLRPQTAVEVRAAAREIPPECLCRRSADRHDPLLVSLADAADEPVVEIDAGALEADRFADAEAGAVEELDERGVAQRARSRAVGRFDQPLSLAG